MKCSHIICLEIHNTYIYATLIFLKSFPITYIYVVICKLYVNRLQQLLFFFKEISCNTL